MPSLTAQQTLNNTRESVNPAETGMASAVPNAAADPAQGGWNLKLQATLQNLDQIPKNGSSLFKMQQQLQ